MANARSIRCILLVLATFAFANAAAAQEGRPIVGTAPFLHGPTVTPETAGRLQAMVEHVLFESNRFDVVEVERIEAISQELYVQGDERYIDGVVTAVAPMGAEYLLMGMITGTNVVGNITDGVRTYSATLAYDLRAVSVGTREIACQARIRTDVRGKAEGALREAATGFLASLDSEVGETVSERLGASTPEAALVAAINDTKPQVEAFIASCFPKTFEVLAVETEGEDGRVEEVLIAGDPGLRPGDALRVVEQQRFELRDGTVKVREIPVAALTVKTVESNGFAVCTVRADDQKKLRDAMQEGTMLIVKTKE